MGEVGAQGSDVQHPAAGGYGAAVGRGGAGVEDLGVGQLLGGVQTADGVMLENGVLRLMGVSPSTLFFSDRPERVTGHTPTAYFVAHWAAGTDGQSFADVPPNAALSILEAGEVEDLVLVLMSPRLENGDLVYDVEILEGPDNVSGQACALFIDVIGRPMSPGSVAGVHRRHRRRARRRVIH